LNIFDGFILLKGYKSGQGDPVLSIDARGRDADSRAKKQNPDFGMDGHDPSGVLFYFRVTQHIFETKSQERTSLLALKILLLGS
jgi:hypothetical protein